MFINYIKIAWRSLKSNRIFSFINIFGLAVGLWACMTVATVVIDDLSYDRQWSKSDDLYRINTYKEISSNRHAGGPKGFITALPENFPEVQAVSKILNRNLDLKLSKDSEEYIQTDALETDSSVWELLDLEVLQGNPQTLMHGQDYLVISERFRNTYYPNENPVGKTVYRVSSYDDEPTPYLIAGVIKNIASNTHLRTDVLLIYEPSKATLSKERAVGHYPLYVWLTPGTDIKQFTEKVNHWFAEFVELKKANSIEFQPIKKVYLHSGFELKAAVRGDMNTIYILSGVALMLLVIACANFVNLSIVRSVYRLKEIGTRKVLGANNRHIAAQFLTESLLFFLISTVLATFAYYGTLPHVCTYLGHGLEMTFVSRPVLFATALACILAISLFVGWYPSGVLSRFRPVHALKGKLPMRKLGGQVVFQKGLVVLQFTITLIVFIGLMVIGDQLSYLKNQDIGYNKENLLAISPIWWEGKGQAFKRDILALSGVERASLTKWIPTQNRGSLSWEMKDPKNSKESSTLYVMEADVDFPETLGLRLETGRFFDASFPTDVTHDSRNISWEQMENQNWLKPSALITDYTKKYLQINEMGLPDDQTHTTPIGVVGHFSNESLKQPFSPTVIMAKDTIQSSGMLIRVVPGLEKEVARNVHALWSEYYPEKWLELNSVKDLLDRQYTKEAKLWQFFLFFSLLVLFLAALGVFGLVEQAAAQRIKEIGIRKVLGASIGSIVYLFSKSFIGPLLVAGCIGMPIAWYWGRRWLSNYAHRVDIEWQQLAAAGGAVVLVTLLTLIWQTVKAALANPVKSLRTE